MRPLGSSVKILYVAPLRDFSGYASASRDYVRALDSIGAHVTTRDLIYDGGNYERDRRESELANRAIDNVEILIQQTTPNEMEPMPGVFNVGAFCWETDTIPQLWVQQLNKMQLVIVPTKENAEVARRCGVITPVEQIPYACDVKKYKNKVDSYRFSQIDNRFKFLAICQYSKKKGLDPLLKAYLSEFNQDENVALILKTYFSPNDGEAERDKMMEIVNIIKHAMRLKSYPPIQLIHGVSSFEEIERLYETADCYVLPSRGEGWGVPHFDALGYGLPAIATQGTGPLEFITPECGWLVDSHMSPVVDMPHPHDFLYTAKEKWHEPHVCDIQRCMRDAFNTYTHRQEEWENKCVAAKTRVLDFSHEKVGATLIAAIDKYYRMWKDVS